jgi:hypothetical protein
MQKTKFKISIKLIEKNERKKYEKIKNMQKPRQT